jgi:hypothetical protein
MTLTQFLILLGENPTEYGLYANDPTTYVQGASLSEAHKSLLLQGSDDAIMHEVTAEAPGESGPTTVKAVITDSAGPTIKRIIELE